MTPVNETTQRTPKKDDVEFVRIDDLITLIEIGHEITSQLNLDSLLNTIAPLLDRVIDYEYLCVGLIDKSGQYLVWHIEKGYQAKRKDLIIRRTKVSQGIVGRAVRERTTQISGDVSKDPDYFYLESKDNSGQRSEIAVPLIYEGKVLGVVALESNKYNAFSTYHGRLLENIGNNLSIAIMNARLLDSHIERQRTLEREILMGRDVQRAMIPDAHPAIKGFEFAAHLEPALNLSGDFYDYIPLSEKKVGIMIGDVAGKGIRAALGMAASRSILRSVARRGGGPSKVLRDANMRLHRDIGAQLLLTLVYGVLDGEKKTFQYTNAGHNPPLLIRSTGKWRALKTGGLLMGAFDKQLYKTESLNLMKGDILFFYTDGLVEAHTPSPNRIEFGEPRIIDFLIKHKHMKASAILDAMLKQVKDFTNSEHKHDDMTIIVMKVH